MPYDVLVREAADLTDEEIADVLEYIAFLRFRSVAPKKTAATADYDGWVRIPGQHGNMFEVLDGFDDPIEDFAEYM